MNRLLTTFVLVLGVAISALSQSQMSSGDIKGTVLDSTGAVMTGVTITLTNIDTGIERRVTSDETGYRVFLLQPGPYEVRAEMVGFAIYTRRPIQLTVGQTLNLDIELQPAALQQEILVQEAAPVIEIERIQQSDTITTEQIQNLPINERNFLEFSLLTPGVTDSRGLVTATLPQAPTSGLSFLGQSGRSNTVTIDGVDNNDSAVNAVRSTISQDAVQEFQINRSNYAAEFGRASGGLINIVSKSGTNNWNGNVFAFFRDQALDARNPFAFGPNGTPTDPPFSRLQSGFTLGGPIRQERTFFFLSYEGLRKRESRFVTFMENQTLFQPTGSQRALIEGLLASPSAQLRQTGALLSQVLPTSELNFPDTVRFLRANSGTFPFRNNDNTALVRLDHSVSSTNQMFGRLTFSDIDETGGGGLGGLKGVSQSANYNIQDYSAVFGDSHFFGPNLVNEFRFQFANRDFDSFPEDPFGPEITISGVAILGRNFYLPSTRNEKRYQFLDNFTVASGKHELKFGGDYNHIPFDTTTEVFLGGRFIFGERIPLGLVMDALAGPGTSQGVAGGLAQTGRADLIPNLSAPITALQSFNFGLPEVYQQGFGDPRATLTNKIFSMYVQDDFRVTSNFTLNLGLRYDTEFQPEPINDDRNNWGPRIGLAYSPNDRSVFRAGYGVYYTPIFEGIAFIGRVLNGQQISQVLVPLTGIPQLGITQTSAQVWGLLKQRGVLGTRVISEADIALLGLRKGVTPPVLLAAHDGIVNPYSQQFSFGVDHEVAGMSLSANYLGNKGTKIIRSRNVNLQRVGTTFAPIDPRILQNNLVESSGSSIYHGMTLSATKRYTSSYQFQVSYTLSKAIDDTTDFITDLQAADQLDLKNERALSSFDQRHRFVVSGVFQSPFDRGVGIGRVLSGMTFSPIYTYASGRPFNLLVGSDVNGDTNSNTDRPAGIGRNTGRGPDFSSLDLRVAKEVTFGDTDNSIEGIFEVFNVFNRVNFSGVNNVVGITPVGADQHLEGNRTAAPSQPLGFTSAYDPRQIQLGIKYKF